MRYSKSIGLLSIAVIWLLCSCSPYNRLAKRNPITSRDSTNLAAKCNAVYPSKEIDSSTTVTHIGIDSSNFFKEKADSLEAVKAKIVIEIKVKYKDTCTSAVKEATQLCNVCFAQGLYEGKKQSTHDTLLIRTTITKESTVKIQIANAEAHKQENMVAKLTTRLHGYKVAVMVLTGLILMILIGVYFLVKKTLIK